MENNNKFIRDAIHKNINIKEPVIKDLIATKEFQRLRWISQLGGAQIAFPSATHTRYTHSLGVYHVLSRVFKEVRSAKAINEQEQLIVKIAGLLHDIGHGPFSHSFEKVLNLKEDPNYPFSHEFYTCAIISDPATEVNKILKAHKIDVEQVVAIIKKDETKCFKYQVQLVSSQLDCDRIDYLMRDAYFTGANYGAIDLDWVVKHMIIDETSGILFHEKALSAIENYLVTRFHMYQQVYLHKSSILFDLKLQNLFVQLIKLASEKYQFKIDLKKVAPILMQKQIAVAEYLKLNDATIISLVQDIINQETDAVLLMWAEAILYHQEKYKIKITNKPKSSNDKMLTNYIYNPKKDPIMIKLANGGIESLDKVSRIFEDPTKQQQQFYELAEIN